MDHVAECVRAIAFHGPAHSAGVLRFLHRTVAGLP